MTQKIGIVTGGGDCPGLNAVIRAVTKAANLRGWDAVGVFGGFEGLLNPERCKTLCTRDLDGLLTRGGTVLGTANRGRFSAKTGHGEIRTLPKELLDDTQAGCAALGIGALVCIGGDGTLTIANQLHKHGIPVVGVPKTIDNDVLGTETTFGFDSAVSCATDALDRLHSTAESHSRIMVLEVMGRYAGWIAAYAGLSGGADVILIPEIPFQYESICRKVKDRAARGRNFTMIVAAEGACPCGGELVTSTAQEANREARLGGVGNMIAAELQKLTGQEARCVVLGHLQRGGSPTAIDRALCTMFGTKAVELIADGRTGRMVSFIGGRITSMPLEEAGGGIRTVPTDSGLVKTARAIGVCFGD